MKNPAGRIENGVKAIARLGYIAGGWCLILLSLMICVEVVLRKVFNQSLQGVDEYGGYALAISSAIGFAYAFYEGSHIRIDVLVRRLPRGLRVASSLVAHFSLFFVATFFAKYAVLLTLESWDMDSFANTPLRTPLVVPQGIWAFGMCLFSLAVGVRLLLVLQGLLCKQWPLLISLLDPRDEDEAEIQRVMQDIEGPQQ